MFITGDDIDRAMGWLRGLPCFVDVKTSEGIKSVRAHHSLDAHLPGIEKRREVIKTIIDWGIAQREGFDISLTEDYNKIAKMDLTGFGTWTFDKNGQHFKPMNLYEATT